MLKSASNRMILKNQDITDIAYVKSLVSRYFAFQRIPNQLRGARQT